jgi:hypothetical protein
MENEITKLQEIITTDAEIISLRNMSNQLMRNYEMVITSSEYLVELTNLYESKTNQKLHEIQLLFGESKLQRYKRKLNYL